MTASAGLSGLLAEPAHLYVLWELVFLVPEPAALTLITPEALTP